MIISELHSTIRHNPTTVITTIDDLDFLDATSRMSEQLRLRLIHSTDVTINFNVFITDRAVDASNYLLFLVSLHRGRKLDSKPHCYAKTNALSMDTQRSTWC